MNHKDLDSHFDRMTKTQDKIMRWGIVAVLVVVALKLALIGGVVYVAWHFISKYW